MGFFIGDCMPSKYQIGDVIFSDAGETLLYGWLDTEEVIMAIEDFFDETIELSDIEEGSHEYWKFVPCRNYPAGYPGLYYPCEKGTRGAFKATRVFLK